MNGLISLVDYGSSSDDDDNEDKNAKKVEKMKLPPPDFEKNNDELDVGIVHQYKDYCNCQKCADIRWRRVHTDKQLEDNYENRIVYYNLLNRKKKK